MKIKFIKTMMLMGVFAGQTMMAQVSYTEHRNLREGNQDSFTRTNGESLFTQMNNDLSQRNFMNNQVLNSVQNNQTESAQDVTLTINLNYDAQDYQYPWIIYIFNETGYLNFAFYQGSNTINIDLPEGNYDFFTEFKHSSGKTAIVIKEQQNITANTTLELNPAESTNLISFVTLNENGGALEPGVHYPATNTYTQFIFERYFTFTPANLGLGISSYISDYPLDQVPATWDFWINDVSDRYSAYNSCIGNKFEEGNYFIVFDRITDFTESKTLTNNPADYIYHEEKFQASIGGENGGKYYGFGTNMVLYNDYLLGGWVVTNTLPINLSQPNKSYISKFKNDMEYGVMVSPHLADRVATLDPDFGAESFSIKATSVYGDVNGNKLFGSDNFYYSPYTVANKYFLDIPGYVNGLPFHPKFSYKHEENENFTLGKTVPVTVTGAFIAPELTSNYLLANFKGQYNEVRESDILAANVTMTQNNNSVFNGTYVDFIKQALPEAGQVEISITNNNTKIEGLVGKNTTTVSYNASEGNEPPTLQMLQFRNGENHVTSRFTSSDVPFVRIAAGDFDYVAADDWAGQFDYVEGNTVEFYYSEYEQNQWTEVELTENAEFFQLPAFGNYYEASLAGIQPTQENVWYDVKVILTDAAGNKQTQTISPAFKLNNTQLGVTDLAKSEFVVYPNPFTNQVNIELPESIKGDYRFTVTDLAGNQVYAKTQNQKTFSWNASYLPKGIYVISIENNKQVIVKKVIRN